MDLFGDLPPPAVVENKEPPSRKRSDSLDTDKTSPDVDLQPHTKKVKSTDVSYHLFGYHGERRGERDEMQDAHLIINDMTPLLTGSNVTSVSYYGVFDGHSGSRASQYTADNLHKVIAEKFPKGDISGQLINRCLLDSYKKTDSDFLALASKATPTWKDGSTATVVMVIDGVVYCSNLGDSKSVLYRKDPLTNDMKCLTLTKDHTSSNLEERKRIERTGGFVREGRAMGIVEVTRSIGDGRFKGCGLIATPHVLRCELTDNDMFVVIACDGLWNVFKVEEVSQFILSVINDESIKPPEEDKGQLVHCTRNEREYRFEVACDRLAVEAVKKGTTDNVTVLIIDIQH